MDMNSKSKVANLLINFSKLPDADQDKLILVSYGMSLAAELKGEPNDSRDGKKVCS